MIHPAALIAAQSSGILTGYGGHGTFPLQHSFSAYPSVPVAGVEPTHDLRGALLEGSSPFVQAGPGPGFGGAAALHAAPPPPQQQQQQHQPCMLAQPQPHPWAHGVGVYQGQAGVALATGGQHMVQRAFSMPSRFSRFAPQPQC